MTYNWYSTVLKPKWAPEAWVFGPVWTFLYILIAISFIYVFYKMYKKEIEPKMALPFALNLIFNFLFSPIQFGLQNNLLASLDIILVLATLVWLMAIIYRKYKWVALINIPYLLWVSFATVLQFTVTAMNLK